MSEMLSNDIVVFHKPEQIDSLSCEIEFNTQDDEYKTMGWVGLNRLLVKLYNDGIFLQRSEYKGLQCVAMVIANNPLEFFAICQDLIGPNKARHSVDIYTLISLNILCNKAKDGLVDYSAEIDPKYETTAFSLDKYFFMALELENNKDKSTIDFRNSHSSKRHENSLDFYTNYFYKSIKENSCGLKGCLRDLNDAHLSMEHYIGHEDPNPRSGKYSSY